mmetsp:Transcript_2172/g.3489  ORF Transcript_2172/g.3489 Transcript_2172/m.3489 type:complete len:309 (+) Transcript_2172:242-1168(+)
MDQSSRLAASVASTLAEVTPRIGTDVRITKDGSMMASLVDRSSMSKTPTEWYREDPQTDLLQVLAFVRHRIKSRTILLIDFLSAYDSIKSAGRSHRMHTGYISKEDFRRALDQVGCLSDMSQRGFDVFAEAFTEVREQREYNKETINYEAVCEVLQGVSHHSDSYRTGTLELPDRYSFLKEALKSKEFQKAFSEHFDDLPLARQPLSSEGEVRFEQLKKAVMHTIFADRISARELLGDFDPHLNTSVSWMKKGTQRTPMINMSPGCISRSQFLRGMHRLAGEYDHSACQCRATAHFLMTLRYRSHGVE